LSILTGLRSKYRSKPEKDDKTFRTVQIARNKFNLDFSYDGDGTNLTQLYAPASV